MNRIRRVPQCLAGLPRRAGALAASAAAVPALAASAPPPPPGWNQRPPMPLEYIFGPVVKVPGRTVVIGGMPGWQIALLAAGAALLGAVLAVIADRARAARRHQMAISAMAPPGLADGSADASGAREAGIGVGKGPWDVLDFP